MCLSCQVLVPRFWAIRHDGSSRLALEAWHRRVGEMTCMGRHTPAQPMQSDDVADDAMMPATPASILINTTIMVASWARQSIVL